MVYTDEMTIAACFCCYSAFNFKDIKFLLTQEVEQLCIVSDCCLNATSKPFGPGMITDAEKGEICKFGLFCWSCGLKKPSTCCASKCHLLFCVQASAFPTNADYVPTTVCALCCLQCLPNCGCCKPPVKEGGAPAVEVGGAPAVEVTDVKLDMKMER